jgi:hypothetical protein
MEGADLCSGNFIEEASWGAFLQRSENILAGQLLISREVSAMNLGRGCIVIAVRSRFSEELQNLFRVVRSLSCAIPFLVREVLELSTLSQ